MSKTETSPAEESKLSSFVSHLFELRDRLLKMVIAIGIFFIILAPFARYIYDLFAKPLADTLPDGVTMLITGVAAPLLVPYKLVLMAAFLIALPYVFYQAWQFVAPGLYKHEKRLVFPLLGSSVLLFYCGIAFAYFVLLPMMFTVLPMFTPDSATYSPDIGSYLDFVMMMFIAFGFSFEMPIATILLISTGTTTAEKLAEKRPYVIVGAFVVGMILTPPDVISQILLAVPMWILFELGLYLSKFFNKRVEEAKVAKEDRSQAEIDEIDRLAEEAEAGDDSVDLSPKATAAAAAAAKTSIADQADALWNDGDENKADEPEHKIHNEGEKVDTNPYQAFENYQPKTEDELDAELDAIEAQELAEEQTEFEILNAESSDYHKDDDTETLSELNPEEMKNLENELAELEDTDKSADLDQDYTDRLADEKAKDDKDKS